MNAITTYVVGVSQNITATFLALVWHRRKMLSAIIKHLEEVGRRAEEAGGEAEGRGPEEGAG